MSVTHPQRSRDKQTCSLGDVSVTWTFLGDRDKVRAKLQDGIHRRSGYTRTISDNSAAKPNGGDGQTAHDVGSCRTARR